MEPKDVDLRRPRWVVATLAVWCAGVALLLVAFSSASIWFDELSSLHLADLPERLWLRAMYRGEVNGGAFHVTLRLLIPVLGDGPLAIRAPSILAWTAGIPFLFTLARRLAPTWPALVATAAYSLTPLGLHHGREARMYAFAATGAVVASLALARFTERPTRLRALVYGLAAGFGLASHFTMVFVVAAHGIGLLFHPDRRRLLRTCWPGALLVAVSSLPFLLVFGRDGTGHVTWIPQRDAEATREIIATLMGLRWDTDWPLEPLLMVPALVLVASGLWAALRLRGSDGEPDTTGGRAAWPADAWLVRVVALWTTVPIAALLAVSWLISPMFLDRYLIVALPAMVLAGLAGAGWLASHGRSDHRLGVAALAGAALVAMVPSIVAAVANPLYGEDYREAGRAVSARLEPGDLVLSADSSDGQLGAEGLLYHLDDAGRAELAPALLTLRQFEDPGFEVPTGTRVWLVSRTADDRWTARAVTEALDQLYMTAEPSERWAVAHLEVTLHERDE